LLLGVGLPCFVSALISGKGGSIQVPAAHAALSSSFFSCCPFFFVFFMLPFLLRFFHAALSSSFFSDLLKPHISA
jgi:hypothetical protein